MVSQACRGVGGLGAELLCAVPVRQLAQRAQCDLEVDAKTRKEVPWCEREPRFPARGGALAVPGAMGQATGLEEELGALACWETLVPLRRAIEHAQGPLRVAFCGEGETVQAVEASACDASTFELHVDIVCDARGFCGGALSGVQRGTRPPLNRARHR